MEKWCFWYDKNWFTLRMRLPRVWSEPIIAAIILFLQEALLRIESLAADALDPTLQSFSKTSNSYCTLMRIFLRFVLILQSLLNIPFPLRYYSSRNEKN